MDHLKGASVVDRPEIRSPIEWGTIVGITIFRHLWSLDNSQLTVVYDLRDCEALFLSLEVLRRLNLNLETTFF